ncbi:hypothetical protein RUM44_002701 [Polyplax serrata]|uniref:Uncharacterized protein n=1 Tax=Polyplax serrata TaxID=468196 RepID=A0ABR1AFI0_POLSC
MTSTKSSGVENLAFEPGPENGTGYFIIEITPNEEGGCPRRTEGVININEEINQRSRIAKFGQEDPAEKKRAGEQTSSENNKVFRPYDEDKMETIDLRRSPEDREDRLQLSRNEFDVHEDSPPDGQRKALEEEDNDPRCGWCFFRPDFLQRFRTPKWCDKNFSNLVNALRDDPFLFTDSTEGVRKNPTTSENNRFYPLQFGVV